MRSLFAALMIILLLSGSVSARTWHVKPDGMGDAPTIQAGIDSASAGDTVLAAAGVYPDNVVIARSELTLASESGPSVTTIGSSASGPAIVVSAADVTIEGFSVAPGPGSGIDCYAGSRTEVSGNIISGRFWGIFANLDGGDCWAHGNVVRDNRGTGLLGCALVDVDPDDGTRYDPNPVIRNNIIVGNRHGIYSQAAEIEVFCNDVWGNLYEQYDGLVVHGTDISEDPLFCGVDLGDLSLRCGSPCAGGAGGCGQIGRFGVACGGPSQAIPSTWGAIKSRYR